MLALNGNTATYMQYSYARAHGIFERGGIDLEALRRSKAKITLNEAAERDLGLLLMRFPEAIDEVLADYRPNQLTNYLYDLAKGFSTFFEQCHVLKAPSESLRDSRLLLCDLTARHLAMRSRAAGNQRRGADVMPSPRLDGETCADGRPSAPR